MDDNIRQLQNALEKGDLADIHAQCIDLMNSSAVSDYRELKKISMLDAGVLTLMKAFASLDDSAIFEIGPFVGGSTIALGKGLGGSNRPLVSIEVGGRSDHPTMGTDDILRDLRNNLKQYGLLDRVTLIARFAHEVYADLSASVPAASVPDEMAIFQNLQVGLLFIDADGFAGFHVTKLMPFLKDRCYLILDDYNDPVKGPPIRKYVDEARANGSLEEFGVFGGGTWFGRLTGKAADLPERHFIHDEGYSWGYPIVSDLPYDGLNDNSRSPLELAEDENQLGPAHALHADIRQMGEGRFSYWEKYLFFSTSDNSDPNINGRQYKAGGIILNPLFSHEKKS